MNTLIPELQPEEVKLYLGYAKESTRHRYPKILHNPGDEFNSVFNFMMSGSYMQPHLHPGQEKIEKIHLVQGKVATLFFDDDGRIQSFTMLESGGKNLIEVPAFTWHTYLILSDYAITYETMMGVYSEETWKKSAIWAPNEGAEEASIYLMQLKNEYHKYLEVKV